MFSIKQQKAQTPKTIKIPASQDKQINMTFVQDVTDNQTEGKSDKKCVLKITKVMGHLIISFIPLHYKFQRHKSKCT